MGGLASYRFSDFILFSENAYYRQFEFYNQAIWPLHLLALVFAFFILYVLFKKPDKKTEWAGRVISILLVASWLWVAVAFLYLRFYQIHVVADWYAFGFVLQAGLLLWYGVIKNRLKKRLSLHVKSHFMIITGSALLLMSFIIYPFIPLLSGRYWQQFEMFALAPDPTAIATFAILLFYKVPRVLFVIPVIWVVLSVMTLLSM